MKKVKNTNEDRGYAFKQIQKIFRINSKVKSKQTVFNAEGRKEIPTATRVPCGTGKIESRRWSSSQLPGIGEKFGFLCHNLCSPEIISVFTQKGGTLKSSFTYSFSRILAINGIRVLIIGLDTQGSVTNITLGRVEPESLDEFKRQKADWGGLYHFLYQDGIRLQDVIKKTDLPTLDIIPETGELAELERVLQWTDGRETVFERKLVPAIQDYDVVIFDNSPSWNQLVKNSLFSATTVISPIGCDIGTYSVIDTNMKTVRDFQENMSIHWRNFLMIPTLLEKTKLSQQIYGAYLSAYSEHIVTNPVRRAIVGQEATFLKKSILEHDPDSTLASDYYDLAITLWLRIIDGQKQFTRTHGKQK